MGRLSIKEMIPKMTNRMLVTMKALMALVSFWIFLPVFEGSDWLKGTNVKRGLQLRRRFGCYWCRTMTLCCYLSFIFDNAEVTSSGPVYAATHNSSSAHMVCVEFQNKFEKIHRHQIINDCLSDSYTTMHMPKPEEKPLNPFHTSSLFLCMHFPLHTPSSSSPWCSQSKGRSVDTAAALYRR